MKKKFKAESRRLLDMMINSIYTHKEIFLREIISNASDAIDKLCYIALTDRSAGLDRSDFEIVISVDKANRILTVTDNGIGMDAAELEKNLGTIAFSGSKAFKEEMSGKEETEDSKPSDIIGQFGVGFYSAFMTADRITVVSKKYGSEEAFKWESDGGEGFTVEPAVRETVGTDVIMHIREDGEEAGEYTQYLDEFTLKALVKKYSDFIRFPVKMLMPKRVRKEGTDPEKPEYEELLEMETLNSMVPIWHKRKSEVKDEEYNDFYKQQFGDFEDPQSVIKVSAEGLVSYDALLFIPGRTPGLYYTEEYKAGLQLYSSGVMIMEDCRDLLPDYFNFVRGVVESPDLSLNISREMLQHNRQLKLISANLEKKVRAELDKMLKDKREDYEKFYANFGRQIKFCALNNYGAKKDELAPLMLFYSSTEKKPVTLDEYVSRMAEDQKYIYYVSGDSYESIDNMPQTEAVKSHSMEILYFVDQADEFVAEMFMEYKGKQLKSVLSGELELPNEKEAEDPDAHKAVFDFIKDTLGDKIDEAKASRTLISHPVVLSSGSGISFEMEKYFKTVQPDMPVKAQRILELNTDHDAFRALEKAMEEDKEKAEKYVNILYNQAKLIAGLPLDDPSGYTDLLCSLWK